MTREQVERIADELRPPPGYKIDPDEWRDCLLDCLLTCGCDWLEWFIARQSIVTVGEAIVQCIDRLGMEKQG